MPQNSKSRFLGAEFAFTEEELRRQQIFKERYGPKAPAAFRECAQTSADIEAMARKLKTRELSLAPETIRRWANAMGIALPHRKHARPRDAKRLKGPFFGQ